MNERIQELSVKAKLIAEEDTNRQISYNAELKAFAEKFAQLIVRECIHVAYNKMAIQKLDGIRPSVVCDAIKEHFGVES